MGTRIWGLNPGTADPHIILYSRASARNRTGARLRASMASLAQVDALGDARMRAAPMSFAAPPPAALLAPRATPMVRPMTALEALAAAAREGLDLPRSSNQSGFYGVALNTSDATGRPYQSWIKQTYLGSFATSQEAALIRARAASPRPAVPLPVTLLKGCSTLFDDTAWCLLGLRPRHKRRSAVPL